MKTRENKRTLSAKLTLCTSVIALTLAALTFSPATANAQDFRQTGKFGIGFGAGTLATLLSAKYFMSPTLSLQANVGPLRYGWRSGCYYERRGYNYCRGFGEAIALSADLLSERPEIVGNGDLSLAWHIGGGLGAAIWNRAPNLDLAAAFVVGLQLNLAVIPIDLVLEYRPKIYILDAYFDPVDFTAHIRYYF